MKKLILSLSIIGALTLTACNNNSDELDEKKDGGIRTDRDYGKAEGDTTKTDEINATGNAESGPNEGP